MRVSVFEGDITEAPAEAVCTSTNPRLSLMMGTGGAVRDRGGFEVLRACEEIVTASGRHALPVGSVHVTTAGQLPYKAVIHCVTNNELHLSSPEIVRVCVARALTAADARGITSVAMPLFGTGHAHVKVDVALNAMAEALRKTETNVAHVVIVANAPEHAAAARWTFPTTP